MRETHHTHERFILRYRLGIRLAIGVIFLVLLVFFVLLIRPRSMLSRETIILVGNPMVVWSWDKRDNSFVRITLPSDTVIDAMHGYGAYSLDALWKLGDIDKKERQLLRQSIQEYLGIPVSWYVGMKYPDTQNISAQASQVADTYFNWQRLGSYVSGRLHTNMSIVTYMAFVKSYVLASPDKITSIDLTLRSGLVEEPLVDGTTELKLNISRFDEMLGHALDEEILRRERVSVAVYNTTDTPSVGQRVARLLGHLGIFVITVGNDSPQVSDCTISASKEVLRSKTAGFIRSLYQCKELVDEGTIRADILLRMGSKYADRIRLKTIQ